MKENIIIRLERENEYHEVENLVRESFLECVSPRLSGALCTPSASQRSGICSRIGFCHDIRWTVDWTEHVYEGCDCSR